MLWPFRAALVSSSNEREVVGMGAERVGLSIFGSPLPCLWRGGKEICDVPSPSIMASLLHDKVKGTTDSPLDSHPGVGEPKTFG